MPKSECDVPVVCAGVSGLTMAVCLAEREAILPDKAVLEMWAEVAGCWVQAGPEAGGPGPRAPRRPL